MVFDSSKYGDLSSYSVLMVDDVPLNLLLVQKMLKVFNFDVRTAANGAEAMDRIAERKPDLILLDLLMPVMDGFEVLSRVRSDAALDGIKIVILSAINSNEDIVKGFNAGANDFIMKPIIMEKLLTCVITQIQMVENTKK